MVTSGVSASLSVQRCCCSSASVRPRRGTSRRSRASSAGWPARSSSASRPRPPQPPLLPRPSSPRRRWASLPASPRSRSGSWRRFRCSRSSPVVSDSGRGTTTVSPPSPLPRADPGDDAADLPPARKTDLTGQPNSRGQQNCLKTKAAYSQTYRIRTLLLRRFYAPHGVSQTACASSILAGGITLYCRWVSSIQAAGIGRSAVKEKLGLF